MKKTKTKSYSDVFDDTPSLPSENDPDFKEEMFSLYQSQGMMPEDVADPEESKEYAAWLEKPENAL